MQVKVSKEAVQFGTVKVPDQVQNSDQYFQKALMLADTTFTPALRSVLTQVMKMLHTLGWEQEFKNRFLESR